MSESVLIFNALCLPAPDVEALIQGRMIVAMPRKLVNSGQKFALYPANVSIKSLSFERYYRSTFVSITQKVFANLNTEVVLIQAWAKCEQCQIFDASESLEALSGLTVWTEEALKQTLRERPYIFLAFLRVYLLPQQIEMLVYTQTRHFVPLPQPITVSDANPVLSDRIFAIRKHQLETRQPPLHPELEELQSALACLSITNLGAKQLDNDIKAFLGWATEEFVPQTESELDWINEIAALGDRSIELEEKKNNYQAGTDFENSARRSLKFLGFKVEQDYKGGAGGLDLFCSQPYPLICECKAGKLIPSHTVQELIKLGGMHLGADQFLNSAKLVIGPGNPSTDTLKAAKQWKVSIVNAMTLQKLVEIKAKYPGAINLFELKQYLESGQIDYKIDEYIEKIERQIELRSQIVQLVKKYQENTGFERASVDSLHGAFSAISPHKLSPEELHEILIELSSPLTGYLGRIKGSDWRRDRFYFLRDFPMTQKANLTHQ